MNGIRQLHEAGVLHGDLKPSNLLLDDNFKLRVADLGLSSWALAVEGEQGTEGFKAPEIY